MLIHHRPRLVAEVSARLNPAGKPAAISRRNPRAAVLAGFVTFAAIQLALAVAADTTRPHWHNPEFFHRLRVAAVHAPPPVVVLGSSRSQMGFSPVHAMDGVGPGSPVVVNLSQSGCQPVGQRMNLGRLFDAGIVPRFLLVEVLPPALAETKPLDDQIPVSRLSHADFARVAPYFADPAAVRRRWCAAKTTPANAPRFDLLAHAGFAAWTEPRMRQEFLWADMSPLGWSPFYPPGFTDADRERNLARTRASFAEPLANFSVNPAVAAANRDLLAECRTHGVAAALYVMPESPTFRGLYSPAARAAVNRYLAQLVEEFAVPVFDAAAWIDDESAFLDGYHLLGPGAEAFSRRFGRECLGPWLRDSLPR